MRRQSGPHLCVSKKLRIPRVPLSVAPLRWRSWTPSSEWQWMTGSVSMKPSVAFHEPSGGLGKGAGGCGLGRCGHAWKVLLSELGSGLGCIRVRVRV